MKKAYSNNFIAIEVSIVIIGSIEFLLLFCQKKKKNKIVYVISELYAIVN